MEVRRKQGCVPDRRKPRCAAVVGGTEGDEHSAGDQDCDFGVKTATAKRIRSSLAGDGECDGEDWEVKERDDGQKGAAIKLERAIDE